MSRMHTCIGTTQVDRFEIPVLAYIKTLYFNFQSHNNDIPTIIYLHIIH